MAQLYGLLRGVLPQDTQQTLVQGYFLKLKVRISLSLSLSLIQYFHHVSWEPQQMCLSFSPLRICS